MLVAEDLLVLLTHDETGRHLVGGPARTPTPREADLISLLSGVGAVPKVVTGTPARDLRRRARTIAAGEFAGAAVGRAVQAVSAAVAAGAAAVTVVGGAGAG